MKCAYLVSKSPYFKSYKRSALGVRNHRRSRRKITDCKRSCGSADRLPQVQEPNAEQEVDAQQPDTPLITPRVSDIEDHEQEQNGNYDRGRLEGRKTLRMNSHKSQKRRSRTTSMHQPRRHGYQMSQSKGMPRRSMTTTERKPRIQVAYQGPIQCHRSRCTPDKMVGSNGRLRTFMEGASIKVADDHHTSLRTNGAYTCIPTRQERQRHIGTLWRQRQGERASRTPKQQHLLRSPQPRPPESTAESSETIPKGSKTHCRRSESEPLLLPP